MTDQKSPKDAQVITSILKDLGISDYEPKVVHQLLEFTNRYISGILDDARAISLHTKKKTIESDDIKLAVAMQLDRQMFASPPSRDIVLEIARSKNDISLPSVKPHNGIRLPPDRYCTTSANFKLKYKHAETNGNKYMISNTSSIRSSGMGNMRRTANLTTIGRNQSATSSVSSKIPIIKLSTSQTMSKPKIQVSGGGSGSGNNGSPTVQVKVISSSDSQSDLKAEPMQIDQQPL